MKISFSQDAYPLKKEVSNTGLGKLREDVFVVNKKMIRQTVKPCY